MNWTDCKDVEVTVDAQGDKVSHGPTPGDLPCPRCLHPVRIYRPTFGSLRFCEKCEARLGIAAVQTFVTLKLMPDQFSGEKKYRGKKPRMTQAETRAAMVRNLSRRKKT